MRNEIYRDLSVRMSKQKLADVLYATIMCKASIVSTFSLSYEYSREQNAYNNAWVRIKIPAGELSKFEEITGIKTQEIEKVGVNNG